MAPSRGGGGGGEGGTTIVCCKCTNNKQINIPGSTYFNHYSGQTSNYEVFFVSLVVLEDLLHSSLWR